MLGRRHHEAKQVAGASRLREERGQTLVEYALIIAVVSLGAIAALTFLRDEITSVFNDSGSSLQEAGSAGGSGGTPPPPPPLVPAPGTVALAPAGPVQVGATLVATASGWTNSPTSYTFSWQRTDQLPSPVNCAGASFTQFAIETRPDPTDAGTLLNATFGNRCYRVVVSATNGAGTSATTATSNVVIAQGAATAVPTPGTVSIAGCGTTCSEGETATATTSGWNANGATIDGYWFEWYAVGSSTCSATWPANPGTMDDRDPNSGTATSTTSDYDLPFASGDYTVYVRVFAHNSVGNSTQFAWSCRQIQG